MNRQVLIILGVVIFIAFVFLIWRFFLPPFLDLIPIARKANLTPTPVEKTSPSPSQLPATTSQSDLLGKDVLFTKTQVKGVVDNKTFWIGPIDGGKNIIVVTSFDHKFENGQLVRIAGVLRDINQSNERKKWRLSSEDQNVLSLNPLFIEAKEAKPVE